MFWIKNMLLAFDQLANAFIGGYADETISLRAARARDEGRKWGCIVCKVLDSIVTNHCSDSIIREHLSIIRRKL